MTRFRGTAMALLVLIVVLAVWGWLEREPPPMVPTRMLARFDEEALQAFTISAPTHTLEVRRTAGVWSVVGRSYRPRRAMIRRVAHQLHDLDARATVVVDPEDPSIYGLGREAVEVVLELEGMDPVGFRVGDPNPTSVSYYMQRIGDPTVFVVKKSAMDFFRLPLEAFREDRISLFDAAEVVRLQISRGRHTLELQRTGPRIWWMGEGEGRQRASDDEIQGMLGRVSALRALEFVQDSPTDLDRYGVGEGSLRVVVTLGSGERIALRAGAQAAGAAEPRQYVLHEQDDAIYAVKAGWASALRRTPEELRNRELVEGAAWQLQQLSVTAPAEQTVVVTRRADAWRWSDGAEVAGSTPKRVAQRATGLRAEAFAGARPPGGFGPSFATLELGFEGGRVEVVELGRRWGSDEGDTAERQYAIVDDGEEVYEVDGSLGRAVEDLWREARRKDQREADKGLE